MSKFLRWLSWILAALALIAIGTLVVSDVAHRWVYSPLHQSLAAGALILIGASYISLQLSAKRPPGELRKGLLLGLAFLLWGGEQFFPAGRLVTVIDSLVIAIFILDLNLIIFAHPRPPKSTERKGPSERGA